DFAIRSAGFGLALGLAPAATLTEAEQASRSETSPADADPYSLVDPEFLPALKQFPAVDLSAEIVRKFRVHGGETGDGYSTRSQVWLPQSQTRINLVPGRDQTPKPFRTRARCLRT